MKRNVEINFKEKKMKKVLSIVLALAILSLAACGTQKIPAPAPAAEEPAAAVEPAKEEPAPVAAGDEIPAVFTDKANPVKIAAIRNLNADDGTKLVMKVITDIGESWGWQVDTFITNSNDTQFIDTVTQAGQKDYDAMWISHGKAEYSYDLLKPLVDKGIKIVTFDTVANDADGNPIPGITATSQADMEMAKLTLDRIVELGNGKDPVKVLKLWFGPGGAPALDRRNVTYEEYEKAGKIETVVTIGPTNMSDVMGDVYARTAAALQLYPVGTIDAAWGSWDELAKGGLKAILEAGRNEIKVITVDVGDVDLNLMRENPDVFLAACGPDQALPGVAAVRLLAYKLAGLDTPATYEIPVSLIRVEDLTPTTTIASLADVVEGWGVLPDYIAPWMDELEALNK